MQDQIDTELEDSADIGIDRSDQAVPAPVDEIEELLGPDEEPEFTQSVAGIVEQYEWESREELLIREENAIKSRYSLSNTFAFIQECVAQGALMPLPAFSNYRDGYKSSLDFQCKSAAEMRYVVAFMGKGEKQWNDLYDRQEIHWTTKNGLAVRAYRDDQTCQLVPVLDEDGNEVMEEITVREVIEPERVREVTKVVPKTERKCPPLLED